MNRLPDIAKLNHDQLLVCTVCSSVQKDLKAFTIHLRKDQHIRAIDHVKQQAIDNAKQQSDKVIKQEVEGGVKRRNDKKVDQIVPLFNYQINKKHNSGVVVEEYVTIISDEEESQSSIEQEPIQVQPQQEQEMKMKIEQDDGQVQEDKLKLAIDRMQQIKNRQKQKAQLGRPQQQECSNTDQLDFIKMDWKKK